MLQKIEVSELMNIENLDKCVAIRVLLAEKYEQFNARIIRQMTTLEAVRLESNGKAEDIKLEAIQSAFLVVYS